MQIARQNIGNDPGAGGKRRPGEQLRGFETKTATPIDELRAVTETKYREQNLLHYSRKHLYRRI